MKLAIYGTNGAGKEALLIALAMNRENKTWDEIVFIDDTKENGQFHGYARMQFETFIKQYTKDEILVHIAVGDPEAKCMLAEKSMQHGYDMATLIHPSVKLGSHVTIGKNVRMKKLSTIEDGAVIEESVTIQSFCNIREDVHLKKGAMIATKAIIGKQTTVGEKVFIGMHSILEAGIQVGDHAVVSMGSYVRSDVEAGMIVGGNPARTVGRKQSI